MFFWREPYETPLSEAIINDDLETIKALKGRKDHLNVRNGLGFSALEIACYLDKRDYLKILKTQAKRQIKVIPPKETGVRILDEVECEKFFHVRYIAHLKFENYDLFKRVLRSCPSNLADVVPYSREFQEGCFSDVTVQWIDDMLGYGVFTNRALKAGDYIGEHVGEVRRISRFRPRLNAYCLRYPSRKWPFPYYVVDAKYQGNEMRFVNHSYEPNLVPKLAIDRGLLHQLFFADRDISKGSQLTWNYGEDFWMSREPPVEI
ncbi:MAG: SET domain-containing protein-lysine N-methyltransferase [Waddliaceae bacterium]